MTLSLRLASVLAGALFTAAAMVPADADMSTDPGATALRALFSAPAKASDLMSPDFASRLPADTLIGYISFYDKVIGVPTSIARDGDDYRIASANGSLRASITTDAMGKILTLRFHDEISRANADALTRALQADRLAAAWFVATDADDASLPRTQKIVDELHAALGKFIRLDTRDNMYFPVFERGETHAQISVDNSGKIVYLSFEKP